MKTISKLYILLIILVCATGCDFSDKYYENPNKPTKFETRFLYVRAANNAYRFNWTTHEYMNNWYQLYPHYLADSEQVLYTQFTNHNITTIDFFVNPIKDLNTIANSLKNNELDNVAYGELGDPENQIGVALTLKAFYVMHMTDMLGMLPYTEAFKTKDDGMPVFQMKYDTQQEIYYRLFEELNEAFSRFDDSKSLNSTYERLYQGNISKWKKFNASLRMMMAIKLQKADTEKGKAEFAKAYKDKGITKNGDNLLFTFLNELTTNNTNWLYRLYNYYNKTYYAPCETLLEQMRKYSDPRISQYCEKNSDGEYVGAILGWSSAELAQSKRNFSKVNSKYWDKLSAPLTITTAANTLFMQAEAALIGWIDGDPKVMYEDAIKASFEQHNLDGSLVANYITHSEVEFKGATGDKIKCIAMQKWIAGYLQDGVEAWSDWRRFKYPNLTAGKEGESVGGLTKGLPLRKTYAENEIKYNMDNYERVLQIQGEDDVYTPLWWNK